MPAGSDESVEAGGVEVFAYLEEELSWEGGEGGRHGLVMSLGKLGRSHACRSMT